MDRVQTGNARAAALIACAAATLTLAAFAAPAEAEIYRWTDAEGRLHFTEQLDRVPVAQRAEAEAHAKRSPRQLNRSSGAGAPAAQGPGARTVRRRPGSDMHIPFTRDGTLMRVEATVNDTLRVPFLVDTGASGISLPAHWAQRLGIAIGPDTERVPVHTANGVTTRPIVTLESVEVGGARVENLVATINPNMSVGLLGGSFFNNFVYRVDAAAGVISLAPNEQIRGGLGEDEWRRRFRSLLDPLERLDAHVRDTPKLRQREIEALARRRAELEAMLAALEQEANRLEVPQVWRD